MRQNRHSKKMYVVHRTYVYVRTYIRATVKLSSVDRSAVTKGLGTIALVQIYATRRPQCGQLRCLVRPGWFCS